MLVSVLLFAVGLVLLIKGGDWFVDGATGIAKRFNLPDIVVGATVVSIGTTLPEVMVSTTGALAGSGTMVYGNAIGSIICNTALIAAISITCNPGPVNVKSMRTPAIFFFMSAGLYCLAAYGVFGVAEDGVSGRFDQWLGFVMLAIFVVYMLLPVRNGLKNPDTASDEEEGEEEDPRAELVQKLLEYKMYKYMAFELRDRQVDAEKSYYRDKHLPKEVADYKHPLNYEELMGDLSLSKLHEIFKVMIRRQEDRVDPIRSNYGNIEKDEVFDVDAKTAYIEDYAKTHKSFSFRQLLGEQKSKAHIIITFLVILEMMKTGKINISQENIFDDIMIESNVC